MNPFPQPPPSLCHALQGQALVWAARPVPGGRLALRLLQGLVLQVRQGVCPPGAAGGWAGSGVCRYEAQRACMLIYFSTPSCSRASPQGGTAASTSPLGSWCRAPPTMASLRTSRWVSAWASGGPAALCCLARALGCLACRVRCAVSPVHAAGPATSHVAGATLCIVCLAAQPMPLIAAATAARPPHLWLADERGGRAGARV